MASQLTVHACSLHGWSGVPRVLHEVQLGNLVGSLMCHLESIVAGGALQENAQIVVRPIFTWPDGTLHVWVMVNWPN